MAQSLVGFSFQPNGQVFGRVDNLIHFLLQEFLLLDELLNPGIFSELDRFEQTFLKRRSQYLTSLHFYSRVADADDIGYQLGI